MENRYQTAHAVIRGEIGVMVESKMNRNNPVKGDIDEETET